MEITIVKEPEAYSIWYGIWNFVKKAAIFILPSLVAYKTAIPADSYIAILITATIYLIQNYQKNKDK